MNHSVSLRITGSGIRVTCHAINEDIFARLMSADEDDALYEDNPLSLVNEIGFASETLAHGFCINKQEDFSVELKIDDMICDVQILPVYEQKSDKSFDPNESLVCQTIEDGLFSERFRAADAQQMYLIETEVFKSAYLENRIELKKEVGVGDINLGLINLNDGRSLVSTFYGLGLLHGMQRGIHYLLIEGKKHELYLEIGHGYASDFYLVKRLKDGNWESKFLSV